MTPKVFKELDLLPDFPYPVLGLGNFDGLHIGHQAILKKVVERAGEMRGTPIAFILEPHPVKVLFPDRPLELLSSYEEKLNLIGKCGIETVICLEFTRAFATQSPLDFVRTFLAGRLKVKEVFVGPNYGFGKDRSGNVDSLRQFGEAFGFKVNVVSPVRFDSQTVSSSQIRRALLEGEVEKVIPMLGRPYLLEGEVIEGENRGRTLGYPTANLIPAEKLIPKNGVYAVTAGMDGKVFPGIVYIGTQPTFHNTRRQVEVHLFDYSGKLYGEHLKIFFYGTVRGEIKFPGREALIFQIEKDILKAKSIIESNGIRC